MTNYYYLDISLLLEHPHELTPAFFKNNIVQAIKQLFGEIGAAINIDVLKYNPETLRAIVRVPNSHYIKLRGSLTLCGNYQGLKCAYIIHKATPLLLALQGDSRDFKH